MVKKKAKAKTAGKKTAKRGKAKSKKAEKTGAEVRKDIAKMVKSHTRKMAAKVIEVGERGQLATVRYLWELANVFPPSNDGSESTEDDDSLAKTLMQRFHIPETPVVADQLDEFANRGQQEKKEPEACAGTEKEEEAVVGVSG